MGWQYPPEICQWDITSQCNLRCRHCRATGSWSGSEDLDFAGVTSILQQLILLAPRVYLAIAGGEPLTRKDLKDILIWLKSKTDTVAVGLLSNGTLINDNNIHWLSELVDGFNISLEGASSEVNDAVRGRGAFDKAVRGIGLLLANELPVTVRMTFFNQQEEEAEKLMRFLSDMGVRSFNFRYVVPVGRAQASQVSKEQYQRLVQVIWSLGGELGLEIGFSDPFPEILISEARRCSVENDEGLRAGRAVTGCSMGFNLLYLDPQGIVKACPYFPIECADAKAEQLEEIWFKNETLDKIRCLRRGLVGKCGQCEYKFACGGCRGAAMANGDFLGDDPRCWKA